MGDTNSGHFMGEGGVVWELDMPLSEVMQEKFTKGYLRRVNEDGTPYVEPVESVEDGTPPPPALVEQPPALSAPKADWVGFAVRRHGIEPGDAEGFTKQDLIDRFGPPN